MMGCQRLIVKIPQLITAMFKGGFEDTYEQYLGGAAGPQFIMRGNVSARTNLIW